MGVTDAIKEDDSELDSFEVVTELDIEGTINNDARTEKDFPEVVKAVQDDIDKTLSLDQEKVVQAGIRKGSREEEKETKKLDVAIESGVASSQIAPKPVEDQSILTKQS